MVSANPPVFLTIGMAVHLIETAGLETGRHQKNIDAGFYLMCQLFVVANRNSNFLRVKVGEILEFQLNTFVAATE